MLDNATLVCVFLSFVGIQLGFHLQLGVIQVLRRQAPICWGSGLRLLKEDRPGWADIPGSMDLPDTGMDLGRQCGPWGCAAGPALREAV